MLQAQVETDEGVLHRLWHGLFRRCSLQQQRCQAIEQWQVAFAQHGEAARRSVGSGSERSAEQAAAGQHRAAEQTDLEQLAAVDG